MNHLDASVHRMVEVADQIWRDYLSCGPGSLVPDEIAVRLSGLQHPHVDLSFRFEGFDLPESIIECPVLYYGRGVSTMI